MPLARVDAVPRDALPLPGRLVSWPLVTGGVEPRAVEVGTAGSVDQQNENPPWHYTQIGRAHV